MNILNELLTKIIPSAGKSKQAMAQPSPLQPKGSVDVEEILRGLEKRSSQKLDWRHSIVDLMKVVGLDSDLGAREQLALELNYKGDVNDTAAMNVWLHAQVMKKLEENGGKIPDEMKH